MTANFKIQTPLGVFPVFSREMRSEVFMATVVYYSKRLKGHKEKKGPDLKADLHIEEGSTEAQGLERLKAWCVNTFGEPCVVSKAH